MVRILRSNYEFWLLIKNTKISHIFPTENETSSYTWCVDWNVEVTDFNQGIVTVFVSGVHGSIFIYKWSVSGNQPCNRFVQDIWK